MTFKIGHIFLKRQKIEKKPQMFLLEISDVNNGLSGNILNVF